MDSNSQNSSHGQIPERLDAEQMLLPLQIADEGVSKGKETNISRSKTSVSNEETRLRGYFLGNEKENRNKLKFEVISKINLSKLPFPWPTQPNPPIPKHLPRHRPSLKRKHQLAINQF